MARLLASILVAGLLAALPASWVHGQTAATGVEIHFLDVGQGDAVLIRLPDGRAVLYDGGDVGTDLLPMLERAGVESLELVIASHNHADHIGGLPGVVERYRPRFIMENGVSHTSRAYGRFLRAARNAGSLRLSATPRTIELGEVRLHVVPPPGDTRWGHNDNSIGLIVEYGAFRASLLGDSEHALQAWWIHEHGELLQRVAVHKASHHGSRNGDSAEMLDRLRPALVVVSSGSGNSYWHPHPEALALYSAVGATVLRTDAGGTIVIVVTTDGQVELRRQAGAPLPSLPARNAVIAPSAGAAPGVACVDINSAVLADLLRIDHIKEVWGRQIVRLRLQREFRSVDDLARVRGIADARVREIRDQRVACMRPVAFQDAAPAASPGVAPGVVAWTSTMRRSLISSASAPPVTVRHRHNI